MPINKYYGGHGTEVMTSMKKQYGKKKGESVFYATAAKKSKHGSGSFSAKDEARGYKVCYDANVLAKMDNLQNPVSAMKAKRARKGEY